MALMNPQFLKTMVHAHDIDNKVPLLTKVDLSYNKLRNVPNFSQVLEDNSHISGVDSAFANPLFSYINLGHTADDIPIKGAAIDYAQIKSFDLRHNYLTYLNLSPNVSMNNHLVSSGLTSVIRPATVIDPAPILALDFDYDKIFCPSGDDGLMLDYNFMP
jgi:hypothetical protein